MEVVYLGILSLGVRKGLSTSRERYLHSMYLAVLLILSFFEGQKFILTFPAKKAKFLSFEKGRNPLFVLVLPHRPL